MRLEPATGGWLRLPGRIVICLGLALSPAGAAAGAGDIVIGQATDQAGLNLEASRDYNAGAKVYFDFVNSQGGVNGHHLVLRTKDDGGVAERTVSLTREPRLQFC